jgi:hypothetical protein
MKSPQETAQESKKSLRSGSLHHFHGPPVCTIHRSVSGALITSSGIQK